MSKQKEITEERVAEICRASEQTEDELWEDYMAYKKSHGESEMNAREVLDATIESMADDLGIQNEEAELLYIYLDRKQE